MSWRLAFAEGGKEGTTMIAVQEAAARHRQTPDRPVTGAAAFSPPTAARCLVASQPLALALPNAVWSALLRSPVSPRLPSPSPNPRPVLHPPKRVSSSSIVLFSLLILPLFISLFSPSVPLPRFVWPPAFLSSLFCVHLAGLFAGCRKRERLLRRRLSLPASCLRRLLLRPSATPRPQQCMRLALHRVVVFLRS